MTKLKLVEVREALKHAAQLVTMTTGGMDRDQHLEREFLQIAEATCKQMDGLIQHTKLLLEAAKH